jgi:hypothetical protein
MWPLISDLKGDWYPADIPESSMRSLQGYKVCFTVQFCYVHIYYIHFLLTFSCSLGLHLHSAHLRRWSIQFC